MPLVEASPTTAVAEPAVEVAGSVPAEEIFVDAFGSDGESFPMLRSQEQQVFEQVHAFMNVSAVLAIISFVAVHRNKSIDLAGMFLQEGHLKEAFDTLLSQSLLLVLFAGSIVLSLWNFEVLPDTTSVYIACEASLLIVLCWLASGALILRKA